MHEILKQIAVARRRMVASIFIQSLTQAWIVVFSIALVPLVIPKLWALPVDANRWVTMCLAIALGIGILWSIAFTILRWPSTVQVATEVDLRLKLRERLSSTLQLDENTKHSAAGQALLEDAQRIASRIDTRDAFPVQLDKQLLWGLVPVLLLSATFLIPNAKSVEEIVVGPSPESITQIKNSTQDLMELVRKQKEKADEEGLDEASDFFKQLQKNVEDLQKSNTKDTKKILSDINQLKEAMQKRRDELGSAESLKKNLANLKSLDKGPAEKMSDAIKDGEFKEASDELQKMMDDLEMGRLSAEQKAQLGKQMDQMAAALEEAAAEHEQAKDAIKKQIGEAEQAGDLQKAAELRNQLAEKQAQDDSMAEMANMAAQMKAAKDAIEKGDQAAAKKALQNMKDQMEKMGTEAKQLQDLDKLIDGANECKKCANGQGEGGNGNNPQWGPGRGQGTGAGERPEEETETRHIESQVQTDMQQGETVYGGKAGGANRKGVSREEMKQAILSTEVEDAEALENIPLPKKQRDHSREYFDSLRK
ncbi:MAG: hypothetical protein SGI77_00735 [Pirellulaceae bacterium]|nr:hypothetical protein [Pirellulaceae bacterium]